MNDDDEPADFARHARRAEAYFVARYAVADGIAGDDPPTKVRVLRQVLIGEGRHVRPVRIADTGQHETPRLDGAAKRYRMLAHGEIITVIRLDVRSADGRGPEANI